MKERSQTSQYQGTVDFGPWLAHATCAPFALSFDVIDNSQSCPSTFKIY